MGFLPFVGFSAGYIYETPEKRKSEFEQLKENIEDYYKDLSLEPKAISFDAECHDLSSTKELVKLIRASEGIVIGEIHQDVSSKMALIKLLNHMKDELVLYMEHVYFDAHQEELDACYDNKGCVLSKDLSRYLRDLDRGQVDDCGREKNYKKMWARYNFTQIIEAAIRNGVKVQALDHSKFYKHPDHKRGVNMYKILNYFAYKKSLNARMISFDEENCALEANRPSGKKRKIEKRLPIYFVGNAHIETYEDVAGIAELVSLPSIAFYDVRGPLEIGTFNDYHDPRSGVYSDYSVGTDLAAQK